MSTRAGTTSRSPRRSARTAAPPTTTGGQRRTLWQRMVKERWSYLFILPGFAFFLLFAYVPLAGNVIAFQDYSPFRGISGSPFVGMKNFVAIFADPEVLTALRNTV